MASSTRSSGSGTISIEPPRFNPPITARPRFKGRLSRALVPFGRDRLWIRRSASCASSSTTLKPVTKLRGGRFLITKPDQFCSARIRAVELFDERSPPPRLASACKARLRSQGLALQIVCCSSVVSMWCSSRLWKVKNPLVSPENRHPLFDTSAGHSPPLRCLA